MPTAEKDVEVVFRCSPLPSFSMESVFGVENPRFATFAHPSEGQDFEQVLAAKYLEGPDLSGQEGRDRRLEHRRLPRGDPRERLQLCALRLLRDGLRATWHQQEGGCVLRTRPLFHFLFI